jgi:DNA-binding beta-propeller fold protein YncE
VDAAGNVYVAETRTNQVFKLAAGSSTRTVLPFTGGGSVSNVAVDTAGTVYTSVYRCSGKSSCSSYMLRLAARSDTWTRLPSANRQPQYVAVDTTGNVYVIALGDNGGVMKLAPESSNWIELRGAHRFIDPQGLAVDTRRNLYVTDHLGCRAPGGGSWFGKWQMAADNAQGLVLKLPVG